MNTRSAALHEAADTAAAEIQFVGTDSEAGRAFAYLADRLRRMASESVGKDTRGSVPHMGESTHRGGCEFPEVLPCQCSPRPRVLPDVSTERAQQRRRIAAYFVGVRWYGGAKTVGGAA
ncbi:hypothetical protein ACN24M_20295 [Streptomyces microflavus]|uniref:hypothetical protein n=1 Tax=Streptomyces microflavus TaxID=1919 RepID=UPI003B21EC5E